MSMYGRSVYMRCDSGGKGDDFGVNFRIAYLQIENKAFIQSEMN
jgi:hypothetical protein